jgi:hypothetical protein
MVFSSWVRAQSESRTCQYAVAEEDKTGFQIGIVPADGTPATSVRRRF